jgi:hypothetical protein
VNWIKSLLINYKQAYLFLFESPQAFQFDDDLIDGMALQPAGVQRKIISFAMGGILACHGSQHHSLAMACLRVHTGSVQREYLRRSTSHSRRLARRRPGSLSSFNQANLHRLVRRDGIKTCAVRALSLRID